MEIYTFEKSYLERYEYFTKVLHYKKDKIIPASEVKLEWSYETDIALEAGWEALWKIPYLTCHELNIHYPTIVLIVVAEIESDDLSALVRIRAVQDDIHLPFEYNVPLIELYPLKRNRDMLYHMDTIAECIDMLRFFYNFLWMPWDADDDETCDWFRNHLDTRLTLFFDMKKGIVSKKTSDLIRTLIREGKDIQEKIDKLGLDISDDEEEQEKEIVCKLMKLHLRLHQIKDEMVILENPAMREFLVKSKNNEIEIKRRENRGQQKEAHFIWLGGSLEETIEALKSTQDFLPSNMFTKTSNCLQEALDIANTGDIIIIGKGEHQIKNAGNLENGGVLKGTGKAESNIIFPRTTGIGPCLLDFSGDEVILENITVELRTIQTGIIVRKGLLKLNNCYIVVRNQSIIKLGIVILPGARLIAHNTYFIGLGTGIVVSNSAETILSECSFDNCVEGLELNHKSKLSANSCSFTNCKEYGIRKGSEKMTKSKFKAGDVNLLQSEPDTCVENCKFENNVKGNICLKSCVEIVLPERKECISYYD
ncbi:protein nessun dorma [Phymastichus coffea]|uniref:protein nessun dorma n=1 Tax=Phymastichus coffea TaxID=108790 RepID=UPI00273BDB80|nr:protein nessun dorma [Phymastichus coffea]XP_058792618.1 protein nessun dorma [Phymastichus coffea]